MFIFSLFSHLIRLALGILLLPLRLLGIPVAMALLPFRILFKLVTRHLMLVMLLFVALMVYLHFKDNDAKLPQLTPAPASAPHANRTQPMLVEAVTKIEDGDSNFATDTYAIMTKPEQAEYSRNFYWAMNSLPSGQVHTWSSYNISGSLRANDLFTTKAGVQCRHFNEVLKVHTVQQTLSGTACQQGAGAWCKLKPNATPSCGLGGPSGGLLDGITSSLRGLF